MHKGVSHKLATEHSIPTARLPIDKFMAMKTRKVLTVDHVFRILGSITEGKTWEEALTGVIPPRKGAVVIKNGNTEKEDNNADEDEDVSKKEDGPKNDENQCNSGENNVNKDEDNSMRHLSVKLNSPSGPRDMTEQEEKKEAE